MPYVKLPSGDFFYRYDGPADAPLLVLSNLPGIRAKTLIIAGDRMRHHLRQMPVSSRPPFRGHGISNCQRHI